MKLSRLACALFLCAGCGGESGPVADKPATQPHDSPDSGFSLPAEPICGDGVVMGAEQCDDSGTAPLDGCNSFCEIEYGFICFNEPSECLTVCGDGLVAGEEQCDDSNKTPGDGCTSCLIDAGWQCVGGGGGSCTTCGDGVVLGTEECDDSNSEDFDGCTGCLLDCGNGLLDQGQEPEECDDGNSLPGDGCSDQCKSEPGYVCSGAPSVCETLCGDGIVAGSEKCDDGAMPDWDYFGVCCSNLSCEVHPLCECAGGSPSVCAPKCGNGVLDPGEECDDGNDYGYDNCRYQCKNNICGDGTINSGVEQCDGGLGCNNQCQLSDCFENPDYPLSNAQAKKSGDECGTPLDGLYCNGFGACVDHCMDNAQTEDETGVDCGGSCGSNKCLGESCDPASDGVDCPGGAMQCVDGVCCNTACFGICVSCNLPGKAGHCTAIAAGNADVVNCSAGKTCDGKGFSCTSLKANGQVCNSDNDCASGECVGVCKQALGTPCVVGTECASFKCVSNVCIP